MKEIVVAGITGDSPNPDMGNLIEQCSVLVCSVSVYSLLQRQTYDLDNLEWIPVTPLKESLERVEAAREFECILIVTSGDPLFFGIGRLLKKTMPDALIRFVPAVSTMQICFSRFGIPWDNATHVSLHGRSMDTLRSYSTSSPLFLFTDPQNNPASIARHLLETRGEDGCSTLMIHVGERLATDQEVLYRGSVAEIAYMEFEQPNCMILLGQEVSCRKAATKHRFGLHEQEIFHSRGLITKDEVRAAVLHALELPEKGVMWDIGAGSGSVSIESSRMFPALNIYSIEKKGEELANIARNRDTYLCFNIEIVAGEAPGCLESLPTPDRIFIGGSGGRLEDILRIAHARLAGDGHLVMTAVTENSRKNGPRLLHHLGYNVTISEIAVRRYTYPQEEELILNPIHLIVAKQAND
jgi:precorrin-6Y C5,15-methyltransferase (decarboxylating)